jgi:hypothetical protein
VITLEDLLDLQIDVGGSSQPGTGAQDPLAQCHEGFCARGDVAMPSGALVQGQQGAPDPDDRPALHAAERIAIDRPAIARASAIARVGAEIGAYEAKTKLPELLRQVQAGKRHHNQSRQSDRCLFPSEAQVEKDPAAAIDKFLAFKEENPVRAQIDIKALIEEGRE